VFNIGADQPYTVLELASEVADAFDSECRVEHEPPRHEVLHAYSDHTRVREVFEPPAPIDLRTGIRRMSAWVKQHGARDPVEFAGAIEIERGLPPSWRGPAQRAPQPAERNTA
jgi:UDP-glucose 4-epimerase